MSYKSFILYLKEYLKEESKEFIFQDYVTSSLNILIQGANVKKPLSSLYELFEKVDNKNKEVDNRTAEEIESDVIDKFRKAWG